MSAANRTLGGSDELMTPDPDVIDWWDWIYSPAITETTQLARRHLVELWTMCNGKLDPQEVLDDILDGVVTPYGTGLRVLTNLRGQAPGTINQYITMLGGEGTRKGGGFLLSVLGETNFKVKTFARLVATGKAKTITTKNYPTVEELKHILRSLANPRDRALVGLLAGTGMRIDEALTRKMTDIERIPDAKNMNHARIELTADETKSEYSRRVYLTKEIVGWVDAYHTNGLKDTEYVFPGEQYTAPLAYQTAWEAIKGLFRRCGLKDTDKKIYSPHSFRSFAQSQMRKAGLNEGMIQLILGHTNALSQAYKDKDEEVEAEWLDKCAEKMTWLTETITVVKEDPRVEKLETAFKALLGQLLQGPATIDGKELTQEQRIERAFKLLTDQSDSRKAVGT